MSDHDFRQFVEAIGPWFDGMAKCIGIINRHVEGIYSGEQLMLDRLKRHTHLIDKQIKELRAGFVEKDEKTVNEIVSVTQNRMINDQQVGAGLQLSSEEFWNQMLVERQRQELTKLISPEKFQDQSLFQPIKALFELPHRLSPLDDSLPALLLQEAIHDSVVSVRIGESSMRIIMDGSTPRLGDGSSLADLLYCGRPCTIDFCGFQITLGETLA